MIMLGLCQNANKFNVRKSVSAIHCSNNLTQKSMIINR